MQFNQRTQEGTIFLWRYAGNPRNYSGWHLHSDSAGCQSLLHLLQALEKAEAFQLRSIKLSAPTQSQLSIPNCAANALSDAKLIVQPGTKWTIESSLGHSILTVNPDSLPRLIQGVQAMASGEGDFSIGPKPHNLWFWWARDS